MPAHCPACRRKMDVVRLHCRGCGTGVDGQFELCKFCALSADQQRFVETFLLARGNLREMERELGVSYPTVRGRLEGILQALGHHVDPPRAAADGAGGPAAAEAARVERRAVLDALGAGEITAEEAVKRLQKKAEEA